MTVNALSQPDGLATALTAAKGAQEACSGDKEGGCASSPCLEQTIAGIELRQSMANAKPKPMAKLEKALKSAQNKVKSMRRTWTEMTFSQRMTKRSSCRTRRRRRRMPSSLQRMSTKPKGPRPDQDDLQPRSLVERHKAGKIGGELKVLSETPLVLTLDGWLGPEAAKSLANVSHVLDSRMGEKSGLCVALDGETLQASTAKMDKILKKAKKP